MLQQVSRTLIVMLTTMAASFAATILLGRWLSPAEFGEFALLKSMLLLGPTLAIFGLDQSFVKLYAHEPRRPVHLIVLAVALSIGAAVTIVFHYLYDLSLSQSLLVWLGVTSGAGSLFLAGKLRLQRHFLSGQLIQGGWKLLFLIFILLAWVAHEVIDIDLVYLLLAGAMLFPFLYILRDINRSARKASMERHTGKGFLISGLLFWMMSSSGLLFGGIDKFLIPIVFDHEMLGIYSALGFIYIISFTMLGSAIGYVIFPTVSRGEAIPWRKLALFLVGVTIAAFAFFLPSGRWLVSLFFAGKYDPYNSLLLIAGFVLLGAMNMLHVILHFIIAGKGSSPVHAAYVSTTLGLCLLYLFSLRFAAVFQEAIIEKVLMIILLVWFIKLLTMVFFLGRIRRTSRSGAGG